MTAFTRFLLFSLCTVALGFSGCGHGPATSKQASQPSSASAAKEEMKKIVATAPAATPTTPTPAPSSSHSPTPSPAAGATQSTTPDERLTLALKHLGAQHGPRGDVLQLPDVTFDPGQARFEAGTGADMQQVAALLHDYPNTLLLIEGYTDSRGSKHLNNRLSLQRAKAVEQALVADGLKATRLRVRGLGSADPIADNGTQAGREKNRRVELVFSNSAGTFASAADQVTAG